MKRRGVSLAEIIMAMGILGICILTVFVIFPTSLELNKKSEFRTVALYKARAKMEEIIQKKGTSTEPESLPVPDLPGPVSLGSGVNAQYNPCGKITWWGAADPAGNTRIQQIFVEVCWIEKSGMNKITLTSLIYR